MDILKLINVGMNDYMISYSVLLRPLIEHLDRIYLYIFAKSFGLDYDVVFIDTRTYIILLTY